MGPTGNTIATQKNALKKKKKKMQTQTWEAQNALPKRMLSKPRAFQKCPHGYLSLITKPKILFALLEHSHQYF